MKRSIITIDNIIGKTIKNGTNLNSIKLDIINDKHTNFTNIELRSLPNGIEDKLQNGVIFKNVSVLTKTDMLNFDWKAGRPSIGDPTTYEVITNKIPNKSNIIGLTNNNMEYANDMLSFFNEDYSVFLDQNQISIKCGFENLQKWLESQPEDWIIQFEGEPVQERVDVSIIAESGDIITINTQVPLTCTHKVQLNTDAQIEKIQELIWNKK